MSIFDLTNTITRYYSKLNGSTDYLSISGVPVDRIVMTVIPTTNGTGLPTGAPAVTAGKIQAIDFSYAGSLSEIGKNGAAYFDGIIADVTLYYLGVAIRHYAVNDNQSQVVDSINGRDGAMIAVGSWQLWQKTKEGDLLGQELVINGDFSNGTANWNILGSGVATITNVGDAGVVEVTSQGSLLAKNNVALPVGVAYQVSVNMKDINLTSGALSLYLFDGSSKLLSTLLSGITTVEYTTVGSVSDIRIGSVSVIGAGSIFTLDNVSVKELIKAI